MMVVEQKPAWGATEPARMTRVAFVCEYAGGHTTFGDTMELVARSRDDVDLELIPLTFGSSRPWERLPGPGANWSVRASVAARRVLRRRVDAYDVVLVHTQTAAHGLIDLMGRRPFVISSDATPISYDEVGAAHGHTRGPAATEALKRWVTSRTYRSAAAVIAWSEWVARSLIADYRVAPARIHRIPAGVPVSELAPRVDHDGPVRLIYVARDFAAKGGEHLLEALAPLRGWHLDAVTTTERLGTADVTIHNGLTPASRELAELYRTADIVVLPTLGDSSPFAVLEGMAAGLPVITTPVGAIPELVTPESGLLVAPRDISGLRAAVAQLLSQPELRRRMGAAGRARVENHYDAERQFGQVLDLLRAIGTRDSRARRQ